ncbi:MAG: 4a-hydroxytetrahydrobiopterin dehydratase [Gammaproteobacteria bacterium]|nr:4a-hydroxytetrahydrobiopterin dehydratase [Gammaproteobacteria bacterium]
MTELRDRHCQPCEGGVDPLDRDQARTLLAKLDDWSLDDDGTSIYKEFSFRNFYRTMSFVNAIAHIANVEGHHPDLEVGYSRCRVTWSTHAIDGLSDNDFICAAKIDALDAQ